jgi:hypothetical protein
MAIAHDQADDMLSRLAGDGEEQPFSRLAHGHHEWDDIVGALRARDRDRVRNPSAHNEH